MGRFIVVFALVTGACAHPGMMSGNNDDEQDERLAKIERRVAALEAYLRQLYDVLARTGALGTMQAPTPTAPAPAPAPAPTPTPAPAPAPAPAPRAPY